MKIDARWALLVYPVLKAQSHEKKWKPLSSLTSYKKDRAPIQPNSWIVKNSSAKIAGSEADAAFNENTAWSA